MDRERAFNILSACPFIQKIVRHSKDETLLERLAAVAQFTLVEEGDVVFRQGDPGCNCYIILDGQVGVYQHKPRFCLNFPTPRTRFPLESFITKAEERKLHANDDPAGLVQSESLMHYRWVTHEGFSTFSANSTLGDCIAKLEGGSLFGELALMNNAPRACSIKAHQQCHMLTIGKEDYHSVHGDLLPTVEAQVLQDFCNVLREKCGSVLLAWRKVFDPRAVGELFFSEFVDALTSLSWSGNTSALWGALVRRAHANNKEIVVGLQEISPDDDRVIERFKFWVEDKFNGAVEMFNALTGNCANASLTYDDLIRACHSYGHQEQMSLVWEFLDANQSGAISLKDMAVLEVSGLKRKCALEPDFEMALEEAKSAAMSLKLRARLQKRAQEHALRDFMRKVRGASGGSLIRGFRRILDRNGNMTVSKVEMLKGCRQVAFGGDVLALWKAMDQDGDGCVQLPEVDVRMALVLANFKKWSWDNHGSCVKAMQHFAALAKRRTAKWRVDDFVAAVCLSTWPAVPGISVKQAAAMLHEAADYNGRRTIIAKDVAFLDTWEPSPWLFSDPDFAGKEQLIKMMRSRYANLIVAWRRLFDRNNKNHVTYKDFSHACLSFGLKNAPGIWRALDMDHLGYISLKNIDNDSAQLLLDFKEWAEETFGTIQFAFRVLDSTNKNAVSMPVFKRVLTDFGFPGDARVLFQSLKPDSSGRHRNREARLRLDDLTHLCSWETALDYDFEDLDDKLKQGSSRTGSEDGRVVSKEKLSKDAASGKTLPAARRPGSSGGKPRAYSTTSELFTFCRGAYEYEFYNEARVRWSKYPNKSYNLDEVLYGEGTLESPVDSALESPASPYERPSSPHSRPNSRYGRPVSPYQRPLTPFQRGVPGTIPPIFLQKPGSAGGKRPQPSQELGKSASLPALVGSARSAGSVGSHTKEDKHLPSLVKKGAEDGEAEWHEAEEGEVVAEEEEER
mmetsp:Transcript_69097/g.131845  ORF Transcript_69097/g.131845 Transcript_69097/m.131845 type:complete len:962 (+) Transcript_69097:139-3024(+)